MPEEKDIHPILRSYIPLVKALAETLGPDYEVVLQSTKDPENSVVAIENGYVTGRKEGAPLTDFALYILKKAISRDFNYVANYLTKTQSGEKLRSTTIFIRDENQDIIGFLL
ncbi:MAG: PAS domain-containing protein [Aminobacterium sp.]|uniref:PAS domain-containing protein n=1 Tax=Aminobacterium sp. TaxID=1872491 RepID=UPI002B1FE7B4|nr:PAS domain-containing protein [Aminobacterium sp.]MEA4877525.1 PAS domain-containing protein [Aminobacterium sp.]